MPFIHTIVVQRELAWPSIVGLPCEIAALKNDLGRALIPHDEDDVAFDT